MEAKLKALLQESDRGKLLRGLEELARDNAFYDLAAVWTPVLLQQNAAFFEPFLQRHLPRVPIVQLRQLLPMIEQAGRDNLFKAI